MFLSEPDFRVSKTSGEWELSTSMTYFSPLVGYITVPIGFKTDLASIPRVFRAAIPTNGKHRLAAVIHDYLYSSKKESRGICDKVFLEAMVISGVPWWKRKLMYRAVRLGGWMSW